MRVSRYGWGLRASWQFWRANAMQNEDVPLEDEHNPDFADLMQRLLEKDPEKRITMEELRVSPIHRFPRK